MASSLGGPRHLLGCSALPNAFSRKGQLASHPRTLHVGPQFLLRPCYHSSCFVSTRSIKPFLSSPHQFSSQRAQARHACRPARPGVVRMHLTREGGNQSLTAKGQGAGNADDTLALSPSSSVQHTPKANAAPLKGLVQGALLAALLQGIVDPAAILGACVLGLTITLVDAKEVGSLVQKAGSLVTARTPSKQELNSIISNLERLLQEVQSEADPAASSRHKEQLAKAWSALMHSTSGSLEQISSDSTNKRITGIIHQVLKQLGKGFDSVEKLSGEQLQAVLAPVLAAAASHLQPVTDSLSTGASQLPAVTTFFRHMLNTLPQIAPPTEGVSSAVLAPSDVQLQAEWDSLVATKKRKDAIFVPLALSAQLTDAKPISVQVYDQRYVLWRPRSGEVAALPEACPHRGASLAMGTLVGTAREGKCVKCPYHGLEFNAAGGCDKKNIFTDALNVVEANGVVWLLDEPLGPSDLLEAADEIDLTPFLRSFHELLGTPVPESVFVGSYGGQEPEGGDPQPAAVDPPPFDDHFATPGFRSMGGFVDIAAPPKAVVDNTFDLHHMTHVHKTTFGGGELIRSWKPNDTTICFEYGMSRTNPFTSFFGDGRVLVKMERSPPYSAMVTVGDSADKVVMKTLTHIVPLSETRSRLIWQLLRNFGTLPVLDPLFRYSVQRILAEDQAVLEGVNLSGVRQGMDLGI